MKVQNSNQRNLYYEVKTMNEVDKLREKRNIAIREGI